MAAGWLVAALRSVGLHLQSTQGSAKLVASRVPDLGPKNTANPARPTGPPLSGLYLACCNTWHADVDADIEFGANSLLSRQVGPRRKSKLCAPVIQ